MADCELCKAERLTPWFWEDDICWVAICKTCRVPMIVYRQHTMTVPVEHVQHMVKVLAELFPNKGVRFSQRRIKGHLHWHVT